MQKLYETYEVVGVMEQQVREMEPILAKKAEEVLPTYQILILIIMCNYYCV